jgi:Domain of unknown function (DUF1737)
MSAKIKHYRVVSGTGIDKINEAVLDHIERGWVPLGGVSSTVAVIPKSGGNAIIIDFHQAMVVYDDTIKI